MNGPWKGAGLRNCTTIGLPPNKELPSLFSPVTRPPEVAIAAEISARLMEWHNTHSATSPYLWLQRLALLASDSPDALWIYLAIQSGDLSALTKTYQEQATELGLDRQSIHERHQAALLTMSLHFPELQSVIKQLNNIFKPSRGLPHAQ